MYLISLCVTCYVYFVLDFYKFVKNKRVVEIFLHNVWDHFSVKRKDIKPVI